MNPTTGIDGCCAHTASGHIAAAPPRSAMNLRRFMGAPSSGLAPDITTPLRKNAAVHHSKNCAMMSQMGQTEKSRQRDGTAGLPSIVDIFDECRHGRCVPYPDSCSAAIYSLWLVNSRTH